MSSLSPNPILAAKGEGNTDIELALEDTELLGQHPEAGDGEQMARLERTKGACQKTCQHRKTRVDNV